ncbi:MAG: TadE/TadG family type IV pilus assembly protein [Persicimonas sp.]
MRNTSPNRRGPFDVLRERLARLHRDESGATLTEFVIMLPIFLLVFNGVMILGEFSRKGSEAPINAYKGTFEKAIDFQNSAFALDWSTQSTTGGGRALTQLLPGDGDEAAPVHNRSGAVEAAATATEGAAYGSLAAQGHMGESNTRARSIGVALDLEGCEGIVPGDSDDCVPLNGGGTNDRLTSDIGDLVGGSDYAKALLDDSVKFNSPNSSGAFDLLNDALDILGARPAIGAGIRYGTVAHRSGEPFTFAGRTTDISAHFSALIPPSTQGGGQGPRVDALRATAVNRLTMESSQHYHYKDLLGIKWSQPLDSASYDVPDYP